MSQRKLQDQKLTHSNKMSTKEPQSSGPAMNSRTSKPQSHKTPMTSIYLNNEELIKNPKIALFESILQQYKNHKK